MLYSPGHIQKSLPQGQPSNSFDGYRHLGELRALSQRKMSVGKRAEHIQRDLEQNAKDLGARDSRSTVLAEVISYGIEGQYISMVVGRFGEFPEDFIKLRSLLEFRAVPAKKKRLHCPPESLRIQRAFGQQGDVDVQAKYHAPLGADGGAWLGEGLSSTAAAT
jgi:hypothetical protein